MESLAACSVVSASHLIYLKVFIYSLLEHNPDFSRDYVVFYEDGDLKAADFNNLRKIYKNFVFKKIPVEKYFESIGETADGQSPHSKKIRMWAYYRLEMFNLEEYDQIIWFDVDMMVINNLDDLFEMRFDNGIMACEDMLLKNKVKDHVYKRDHKVQGGLVILGKNIISKKVYCDLINLLPESSRFRLSDQSMFIEYFGNQDKIKNIHPMYNCGRKLLNRKIDRIKLDFKNTKIIHFAGSQKPGGKLRSKHLSTQRPFKMWLAYEKKVKEIEGVEILKEEIAKKRKVPGTKGHSFPIIDNLKD